MKTFISLFALVAVASAANPGYAPAPSYKEAPAVYSYQYGVDAKDDYNQVLFGASEARDGYATNGQYNVLLPDGRTQTVTYTVADDYSGYVADVQYSGYAAPAPAYKAAPAYKPAPAYHGIAKRSAPAPYAPAPSYKETPALYSYQYGVDAQDGYNGYVRFGANEARDGYATNGQYNVLLPDGRTQTVTYTVADDYSGYVADVKYSGDYKPAPAYKAAPAPAYKPAPAPYKAAPAPLYRGKRSAPAPYAPAPYAPAPAYKETPALYSYQYGVDAKDDYNRVLFGASEARDGYATNGQYNVLLPDGRTQTVTYTVADDYSGYVADVQYSGYAEPSYKAAPAYKPAPAYHA